jgi:pimeloyl-ACP methyl ester carboxylesterase
VLGSSYGGGIAIRVVDQHPELVHRLTLASTTAYEDYEQERAASPDYQARSPMCARIA